MAIDKDTPLFDDKSFSDLLRDVYTNNKKKEAQITGLIDQLKLMIKNLTDAAMVVPLIKEYLEISVKNDDNLVRLTAIIQRIIAANAKGESDSLALTEAERAQLMQDMQDAQEILNNSGLS